MRIVYFHRVALLPFVVAVDESTFDLAHYLPENVGQDPNPDVFHGSLSHVCSMEFLEFSQFLAFMLIGYHKTDNGKGNHNSIDDEFCYFWLRLVVHLQCPSPKFTI